MRYATEHRKEIRSKTKLNSNCLWKCLSDHSNAQK